MQFMFILLVERIGSRRGLPRRSLMRVALGFCLRLFCLLKLEDARVGLIGHFGKQQQVVATEALRALPLCRASGHAEWVGFLTRNADQKRILVGVTRHNPGCFS